jgi:hypothetical protein
MKCKRCNMQMSPERTDEILTDLVDGEKPERLCDDCIGILIRTGKAPIMQQDKPLRHRYPL